MAEIDLNSDKPIVVLDWDGTLLDNTDHPFTKPEVVEGTMRPGWYDFLCELLEKAQVVVLSARCRTRDGIDAMREFMRQEIEKLGGDPTHAERVIWWDEPGRPPAKVELNDRAMTYVGAFPPVGVLLSFKTWNGK